jgi:protein phosphatase
VLDQLIDAAVDPPRSSAAALELLGATIRAANREVHEVGHRLQTSRPMGTTIVAVWFLHGKALIGHVGDSRCYRLRAGKLLRLTNDHSFLEETLGGDGQPIDPEFAARYPHILTRSIGQQPDCVPDLIDEVVMAGDRFLLCSDGLTGELDDEEIRTILAAASTAEDASAQLVAEANRCGGRDNVTVMVASVGDTESSPWQH